MEEKREHSQINLRVSHLIIILACVIIVLVAFGGFIFLQQKEIALISDEVIDIVFLCQTKLLNSYSEKYKDSIFPQKVSGCYIFPFY
jgi:hypothetical protein